MNTNNARTFQTTNTIEKQQQTQKQVQVQVHKSRWITRGEKALYSFASALLISVAVFLVTYSSTLDSLNRDIQDIEGQIQQQQITNEGLEYQVKELSNPNRIVQIAKEHGLTIHHAQVMQANPVK